MNNVKLGNRVRDKITGFEGIAVARVEYLTGCTQIGIAPGIDKDGKVPDTLYFDYTRLDILDAGNIMEGSTPKAAADKGGPNRDAPR